MVEGDGDTASQQRKSDGGSGSGSTTIDLSQLRDPYEAKSLSLSFARLLSLSLDFFESCFGEVIGS